MPYGMMNRQQCVLACEPIFSELFDPNSDMLPNVRSRLPLRAKD